MTDGEILKLLLEKVSSIDERVSNIDERVSSIESDVAEFKYKLMKSTAELKAMDGLILDEVERVHTILDKHKENKSVHTA